jgi:serine protease Do
LAQYLGNPTPGGCYVVDVYEGSPLSKAGVKPGDMIYEINGHKIDNYGDLSVPWNEDRVSVIDYVSRLEIGQSIKVLLYRSGVKKTLNFKFDFSELLPVHKIFPGYDPIEYEIFGGMLLQQLRLNHLPALINGAPSLAKYMEFENQVKPALIVTHVVPNSQVQRLELLREGSVITEVNGKEVTTLEGLRTELRDAAQKEFITFKTTDGVFFVLSPDKVLADEKRLAGIYHYPISPFMQILLDQHEKRQDKQGE